MRAFPGLHGSRRRFTDLVRAPGTAGFTSRVETRSTSAMPRRAAAVLAVIVCGALAGCGGLPRMPRIDMGGVRLPRFELFRYGVEDPAVPTTPYKLTDGNVADVKSGFSAAFTDGRTLVFGPIGARRKPDGSLAVCGLVSVRGPDGSQTGMKLFDGRAEFDPFGTLSFRPNRLAGANGRFLDIYTDCRNVGLL
jgi:hypothetical protein